MPTRTTPREPTARSFALLALRVLSRPPGPEGRVGRRVRIASLRALVPVLLRRYQLPELLSLLDGAPDDVRSGGGTSGRVLDALRGRAMTCLHRAIAGYAALRAQGEDVRFVIGVARGRGDLVAHAWLERDGAALGEPENPRTWFAAAFVHPAAPTAASKEKSMPPAPSPDVILTELQDGTGVLLHLRTKFYYALNRTGVAAWKMIERGEARTAADVARLLVERFSGVGAEEARRDAEALLTELRAEKLLPAE